MLQIVFIMLVVCFVALVWFFVMRASVRANEQIRLLQEIAEQQRAQTALLKLLVPSSAVVAAPVADAPAALQPDIPEPVLDGFNVIPER